MPAAKQQVRRPNKRGDGARLQDEVIAAASAILRRTGRNDAVTLRAVAREAGITAPAIYAHFSGREDILCTVIAQTFSQLAVALQDAAELEEQPVPRLLAICRGYLDFAAEQPHHYRVLFERHRMTAEPVDHQSDVQSMVGADAFGVLLAAMQACVSAGQSSATSAQQAATRVWIGLHGQATLLASLPWFPWPDRHYLLHDLVVRLGDLTVTSRPEPS